MREETSRFKRSMIRVATNKFTVPPIFRGTQLTEDASPGAVRYAILTAANVAAAFFVLGLISLYFWKAEIAGIACILFALLWFLISVPPKFFLFLAAKQRESRGYGAE
ncbi:hypothetical protein [Streptomonospora alba]|uniref:hypothetical protein n=1 Tax=Streptomonospora alba TaxID=183763 RepID=UPI0012ED5434|nr:hypothetical protein [Streptomonospora alba]